MVDGGSTNDFPAIISPHSRIRHPEHFRIGRGSILDDFCYVSVKVIIGEFSHVASGCSLAGGLAHTFRLGDFSSLSSGVKVWCASADFVHDAICSPMILHLTKAPPAGDVTLADHTGVGSNSVIMPDNRIPEGVAIGALSFVPRCYPFKPWTVYAGTPVRPIKPRDRDEVLRQVELFRRSQERR